MEIRASLSGHAIKTIDGNMEMCLCSYTDSQTDFTAIPIFLLLLL